MVDLGLLQKYQILTFQSDCKQKDSVDCTGLHSMHSLWFVYMYKHLINYLWKLEDSERR